MKKLSIYIFTLAAAYSLTACFELEKVNPNQPSEETFWETEDHLFQGTIATYDALQLLGLYGQDTRLYFVGLSDEGTNEAPYEFNALVRFAVDDLNQFESLWDTNYELIGRAYQVIDRAPEISGNNVPALVAEMRFMVALGYYNLVVSFGEHIAYVDQIQNAADRPRRAEDGELYALIEDQLMMAIDDLPLASEYSEADYGRVTQGAAQALLGKVYMQQGKYQDAEQLLGQVIQSGEYALLENYGDNFIELNNINREAVFHVNFLHKGLQQETNSNLHFKLFSAGEAQGAYGDMQPTNFVFESFQRETDQDGNPDPRRDVTLFHENSTDLYYGETHEWWLENAVFNPDVNMAYFKYSEQEEVSNNPDNIALVKDGGTDFIVIRYADVLLLYAEALNENGKTAEAYAYVDQVRERSNMRPLSEVKPGLGKETFQEQLKQERMVELAGEAVRFFDLKRWGMYNQSSAAHDPNFTSFTEGQDELFAIPQSELDLNENLRQNPGY